MDSADGDSVYLTAKDYKTPRGVVSQMNTQLTATAPVVGGGDGSWYVRGPMGMGLSLDPSGHNVAFAGGTGVLVFLDIVARLVLQNCAAVEELEGGKFGENFKFTLYYTAPTKEQAIGIELCESLVEVCTKKGI